MTSDKKNRGTKKNNKKVMNSGKIWYISKYALNSKQSGATRQYLFSKAFVKKGYNVCLVSSNSNGIFHFKNNKKHQLFKEDGFEHYVLKGGEIKLGANIKRIISWVLFEFRVLSFFKKKRINRDDVLIVSSLSILTFLTGIYFKKKFKVKLVVEIRDIWPLTLIEFKNMSKFNPIILCLSKIETLAYKHADVIIGTMVNLKEHVKNVAPGNEKKVNYIPMGLDASNLGVSNIDNIKKESEFIVGYAGTLGVANKVDLILEAANILKTNKSIKFKILGDGPLKEMLMNKYKNLDNVEFLPKVKKLDVMSFLSNCDVLLNPWRDHEIYKFGVSPNKWIDYMYAAKPIIVSYNGFRNIINEAQCGEFIEANNPQILVDTIVKYSKKPKEEVKKIGLNGKQFLEENLTYDKLSGKYIDAFKSI